MSLISKMEDDLEDLEEQFLSPLSPIPTKQPGIEEIQVYRRNYRLIKRVFSL